MADRPFELNLDLPTDKTTAFNLELPPEAVAAAMEQPVSADAPADTEPDQATAAPEQQPTPHHLEEIVIDDIPDELRPPFVWDEAAALTCAHAEFALDALIAEDDGALDETLDQAADWATQSDNSEVSVYAGGLASTRGLADAEALVIDVLSTCTRAGYELTTTLNRRDYGVSWNRALDAGGFVLGNDVEINIALELVKQESS